MTSSETRRRIDRLNADANLSAEEKVAGLMQIYLDARALQRAANEGGMVGETPHSADDVAAASDALLARGVEAASLEDSTPANL